MPVNLARFVYASLVSFSYDEVQKNRLLDVWIVGYSRYGKMHRQGVNECGATVGTGSCSGRTS